MSNALGAVLQGLERGAGMGLNMYQALNAEARAKRQEQFQIDRANRQDFESDRAYDYTVGRDEVADEQWEKGYQNTLEELGLKRQQLDDSREHNRGMRSIYQQQQDLNDRKFNNELDNQARTRAQEKLQRMTQAYGLTEDGRELTRDEFYERFENSSDAGTYLALHGFVEGLYGSDRLTRYGGALAVPAGDGRYSVGVTSADGSFEDIKPATARGSSDPDDPVMAVDPYEVYLSNLPGERAEALRNQARNDALIDMDAEHERGIEEDKIAKERERAEAEVAQDTARLAELEAKAVELRDNYVSWATGGQHGPRRATSSSRRQADEMVAEQQKVATEIESLRDAISRRQANLEANEQKYSQSLADIDLNAQRARVAGDYQMRLTARQSEARQALDAADKENRSTVNTAVKEINAKQKADFGKKANHLDPNMVQAQYDRLPPEMRQRLASAPGLLRRAVSHMGEYGLTSFEYLLDLTDVNDEGMQHYYRAAEDPAVRSQVGEDPNMVHAVAKAVATHMRATPGVSYGQTMEAVLSGKPLPEKNNSLGAAASRAAEKWIAPGIRDMFR